MLTGHLLSAESTRRAPPFRDGHRRRPAILDQFGQEIYRPSDPQRRRPSGGISSFGHAVEYQFNWGDGTSSPWFGAPVATHAWSGTAVYTVSVQARCATDPSVVSPLSSGYMVNLTGSTTYTISGQVQQPDGSGIGGTILAARDAQNTLITTVISDASGNYALSLPAGSYSVTATSPFGAFSPATLSVRPFRSSAGRKPPSGDDESGTRGTPSRQWTCEELYFRAQFRSGENCGILVHGRRRRCAEYEQLQGKSRGWRSGPVQSTDRRRPGSTR